MVLRSLSIWLRYVGLRELSIGGPSLKSLVPYKLWVFRLGLGLKGVSLRGVGLRGVGLRV